MNATKIPGDVRWDGGWHTKKGRASIEALPYLNRNVRGSYLLPV